MARRNNRPYFKDLPFNALESLRDAGSADKTAHELLTDFGDISKVREVVGAYCQRAVLAQQKIGDFEGSIQMATHARSLLGASTAANKLMRIALDLWAVHLRNQPAYRQALHLIPNDGKLRRSAMAAWHGPFQNECSVLRAATRSTVV